MSRPALWRQLRAAAVADSRALRLLPPNVKVCTDYGVWFVNARRDRLHAPMRKASTPGYWANLRARQAAAWAAKKAASA